ncbi:PepSY domain-containing protein [Bacillus sp. FJAT-27245]|uniref:PepSY domain-containing protein n=1 Tax=Bacillus sp. FJAT-27245 TaxID=1684144 RepID=UPI0006A7DEDC|nr:PepSY domain-containing protein [Bacillus sp. FJAT-27245]
MGKKWGLIALFCSLFILSALLGWLLLKPGSSAAEAMTKEDAKKLVENRYGGNVSFLQAKKQLYYARLDIKNQSYEVKIDSKTGKILSIDPIGPVNEGPTSVLSEDEIKKIILSKAGRELISFKKTESGGRPVFVAVVRDTDQNTTTVSVDAETGEVLSEKTTPANPPTRLTEKKAIAIAQKEVKGKLDDVDLETENGQTFYLIEIKTSDDREATVQIHAITGAVMSVTWDDN